MKKISLCTVCMNRLFHIRETLPLSIYENQDYNDIEFILLDYNSSDGLENWIKSRMMKFIEQGKLKYYRTYDPQFFNVSHSKNVALRLASNDIIGLVDADNYAGRNYAEWINHVFLENGDKSIVTTLHKSYIPFRDAGGKLAFHRNLFMNTNGFDEDWVGYGFDDVDLVNRLEINGGNRVFISDPNHLKCIGHSQIERISNSYLIKNLISIYSKVIPDDNTALELLYLYNDRKYILVKYIYDDFNKFNFFKTYRGYKLSQENIQEGNYEFTVNDIIMHNANTFLVLEKDEYSKRLKSNDSSLMNWESIPLNMYLDYVLMLSDCKNRLKLDINLNSYSNVNKNGWGKCQVYLNFDKSHPINLL